jgi:hypothetical protein
MEKTMNTPGNDQSESIACEQVVASLTDLRDVLVETSLALRDLLFALDAKLAEDADACTKDLIQRLKQGNQRD